MMIQEALRLTGDRRTAIIGLSGSGKTFCGIQVLDFIPEDVSFFIADTHLKKDYGSISAVHITEWEALRKYMRHPLAKFRVVYSIKNYDRRIDQLNTIAKFLFERGDVLFVFDEVDSYRCKRRPGKGPVSYTEYDEGPLPPWVTRIFTQGRSRGVDVLCLTQRAKGIPKHPRTQLNQVVSYVQYDPEDVKALRSHFRQYADMLPTLGEHEFLLRLPDYSIWQGDACYQLTPLE